MDVHLNAVAGPSSEGAVPRRQSNLDTLQPVSPSSAPPVPSAIAVTHPSQFIHTHHPRRGSQTPLGLHLISPVPPQHHLPTRNVGFHPNDTPEACLSRFSTATAIRRDSMASTTSTLTLTRPPPSAPLPSHTFYPANFSVARRQSSFTPSAVALTPASPTRAHAKGKTSRPASSDGNTLTGLVDLVSGISGLGVKDMHARRGSLPHLGQGNSTLQSVRGWNPSLPPQRSSVDVDDAQAVLPKENYKFGSGVSSMTPMSFSGSPFENGQGSEAGKRDDVDVFEQTEADEAERQQRAFLAATYGADGRRARERLSIGGQGGQNVGGPRRQSLKVWERVGMIRGSGDASTISAPVIHAHGSNLAGTLSGNEEIGERRGSLPIAIPGAGLLGKASSRREPKRETAEIREHDEKYEDDEDDDEDEAREGLGHMLSLPVRPLPPLLPLSDPGPRLLPSTLALHRANHLLNSRNLQSDPLPPPLPSSLHPPDPVDITEFDLDFILAGSQSHLAQSSESDIVEGSRKEGLPNGATLKLGRDGEDTFAKFVGEFDDEYGGRRGEWTFRSCHRSAALNGTSLQDPINTSTSSEPASKTEWESTGAGKYELLTNGEVKNNETGRSWRVRRVGAREYELEEVRLAGRDNNFKKTVTCDRFTLASKCVHRDQGGVKVPYFDIDPFVPVSSSHTPLQTRAFKHHANISEDVPQLKCRGSFTSSGRSDSTDSSTIFIPHFQSMPSSKIKKKDDRGQVSRDDTIFSSLSGSALKKAQREHDTSREPDDRKDRSFGGVLKRGLLSSFKSSSTSDGKRLAREEREKEQIQAHSWSGSNSSGSHERPPHLQHTRGVVKDGKARRSSSSLLDKGAKDDGIQYPHVKRSDQVRWKEGKAWDGVPEDAVAMIIPLKDEASSPNGATTPVPLCPTPPHTMKSSKDSLSVLRSPDGKVIPHPFFCSGSKQAMLVWFVPFNSEYDDEPRPSTASSKSSMNTSATSPTETSLLSSSLPKFQRFLRRRASKDKEAIKREAAQGHAQSQQMNLVKFGKKTSGPFLPFRSFRVVARVVDCKELRSGMEGLNKELSKVEWSKDGNVFSPSSPLTPPNLSASAGNPSIMPFLSGSSPSEEGSTEPSLKGRSFPTVIAVCHSRSQGVEFVVEGLDRLGLCKGESAWGPTGYEEWRGTGLSEYGRRLMDLLWAGCTGVMGLSAV
ncbi:uncharacterized protein L203_101903 [Cryptococcus depauperatus CBS 7841]|uniref:Uncharacterized protein n=1 Tax=Cryptococcus depauperatus CBS 7841 TaxID=1295531 RepID=A0A1E3IH68_9TREE|nr:hypothetical protein L203_03143 [Cryptococcus depauperatus CBS 7841]